MGFDVSATHTVFFIAAIVVAAGAVGVFNQSVQKFNGDVSTRSNSLSNELTTDIRVINDPASMPNDPVVLYVLNTGSSSLTPDETIVLVDGQVQTTMTTSVIDASDGVWRTGQVLQITLTGLNLPNGDHRVKVIAEHGVADTIRFSL